MLGTDVRQVERMIQRGMIPCQKISGQLRVNRAQIQQWLHREITGMETQHLADMDNGMTSSRRMAHNEVLVAPLLRNEAISVDLGAKTKSSTLRRLVALADQTGLVWDTQALLDGVWAREEVASTALTRGVAIPHPDRPLPYALAEPVLVVARSAQPLVFGAGDGGLTQLFFLTASQDGTQHLHLLARLCRMLKEDNLIEALIQASSEREMMELLIHSEATLLARSL